ncbi:MAG: MarR family transcriptional regulator [Myxococcota bacterium]
MDDDFRRFRRGHLGRALVRAKWAFDAQFDERIRAAGFDDYRPSDVEIVARLPDEAGTTVTELVRRARRSKQAVGKLVSSLEERGYVQRRPDPDDGRAQRIFLTSRGERFLRAARTVIEAIEDDWCAQLSERRVKGLKRALLEAADAFGGEDYL